MRTSWSWGWCVLALAAGGCSAPGEDVDGTVGLATELIFQDDGGQMIRAVATADWDGDGDLDGAAVGDPGVRLYSAEGGGFSLTAEASAPDLPWSLAFADVDSDGALDLILGLSSGRLIARDPSDGTLDGTYTELAQVADQGSVRSMSWSTPGGRPCPITPSGPPRRPRAGSLLWYSRHGHRPRLLRLRHVGRHRAGGVVRLRRRRPTGARSRRRARSLGDRKPGAHHRLGRRSFGVGLGAVQRFGCLQPRARGYGLRRAGGLRGPDRGTPRDMERGHRQQLQGRDGRRHRPRRVRRRGLCDQRWSPDLPGSGRRPPAGIGLGVDVRHVCLQRGPRRHRR